MGVGVGVGVGGHAVLVAARFSKRVFVFLCCRKHWSIQCIRVCLHWLIG